MRKIQLLTLLPYVTRWVLGLVFIYAGFSKLLDPAAFSVVISGYGLAPEALLAPLAIALPILEIIAGLGLIIGNAWSLHIITALLVGFILILTYGLWLGLDVDCGCFARGEHEAEYVSKPLMSIYRDLGMLVGVLFLYYERFRILQNQ